MPTVIQLDPAQLGNPELGIRYARVVHPSGFEGVFHRPSDGGSE